MASKAGHANPNPNAAPRPTWRGHVDTTMDALILFEACLNGDILHFSRRVREEEREGLIRSGNVFIYEEHSSGIKRWTDGCHWSPSRVLNNFLIYRELEKTLPPGKKALKKNNATKNGVVMQEGSKRSKSVGSTAAISPISTGSDNTAQNNADRALMGSLVGSYPFKEKGLVKKTISVNVNGGPHHLVSYYNIDDVKSGRLVTSCNDPTLNLTAPMPRAQLITGQNFRIAVEHEKQTFSPGDGSWCTCPRTTRPVPVESVHIGEADWASQTSMSVPTLQPSLSVHAQNQSPVQQQALASYDPQHQSDYYQVPGHQMAQEYALSTNNFQACQPVVYTSNGLPELLSNQQQNTVYISHDAWEGTEFPLPVMLSISAAEPRVF